MYSKSGKNIFHQNKVAAKSGTTFVRLKQFRVLMTKWRYIHLQNYKAGKGETRQVVQTDPTLSKGVRQRIISPRIRKKVRQH